MTYLYLSAVTYKEAAMTNITTYTLFIAETHIGTHQFRYNGSLTVNVYIELGDESQFGLTYAEVDVFTLSEPGIDNALQAVQEYVAALGGEDA